MYKIAEFQGVRVSYDILDVLLMQGGTSLEILRG